MLKILLAAVTATALVTAPVAAAYAQATTTTEKPAKKAKTETKTTEKVAKPLTPQQQKMKDCAGKWKEEKVTKKVSGRAAYNKFMSGCLKGSAA